MGRKVFLVCLTLICVGVFSSQAFAATVDVTSTIQSAIDAANDGDTIQIPAGTYTGTIDIDSRNNLSLVGTDKATVIVKPSSTLTWGVGSGSQPARSVAVRVVDSIGTEISNITFDFDTIKANAMTGALIWDSPSTIDNNVFKNLTMPDTGGGYYEVANAIYGSGYTAGGRAQVTVSNNEYKDTGRLAIQTHSYVNTVIDNNLIYKTIDDFGYGVEMGSESSGEIINNEIYGFDTSAASDGSSAGAYILKTPSPGQYSDS